MTELAEDAPLTPEEILLFGPCVEAQVWHPVWVQESRAPIAVAAGRAKLGKVFDDQGVGNAVVIRPCVSRGARLRGLPPIYTPQMLEANSSVFNGWPMFTDHVPREVQGALAKAGRSVRDLGGQVLTGRWNRDYVHEDDAQYGYQKGATMAQVWATPFIRKMVSENANLLHTSINAWPTAGKPGTAPWRPSLKGMMIEGIRKQPQGSLDYVVRGGAGGRLLVAEGFEDEGAWPEIGEWDEGDRKFVVSLAESFYASPRMADLTLPSNPGDLKDWLAEHAPHLSPALAEAADDGDGDDDKKVKRSKPTTKDDATMSEGLTAEDVKALIQESQSGTPTVEEFEAQLEERTNAILEERESQRLLSTHAMKLIESADGIPVTWKSDLKGRYAMLPSGAPASLLVESETAADGTELTELQVLERRVTADIDHTRELIAEATGRPRVTGEGGAKRDASESGTSGKRNAGARHWRQRFREMGIVESDDKAVEQAFGARVTGD